jgi:hypothetical protein
VLALTVKWRSFLLHHTSRSDKPFFYIRAFGRARQSLPCGKRVREMSHSLNVHRELPSMQAVALICHLLQLAACGISRVENSSLQHPSCAPSVGFASLWPADNLPLLPCISPSSWRRQGHVGIILVIGV